MEITELCHYTLFYSISSTLQNRINGKYLYKWAGIHSYNFSDFWTKPKQWMMSKKKLCSIMDCCVNWSEYFRSSHSSNSARLFPSNVMYFHIFLYLTHFILIVIQIIIINLYRTFVFPVQSIPLCRFFCFSDDYRHSNGKKVCLFFMYSFFVLISFFLLIFPFLIFIL